MGRVFVRTHELRKIYKMGETEVKALDGVTFDINEGDFAVLMGPSGSGKSTSLYLIGGLDWPSSGHIEVDGEQVDQMDETELARYRREKLGFIFQSFNLVSSMTALANVGFPLRFSGISARERDQKAKELLGKVGLGSRIHHRPTELSGGQQQRVAVARALVNNPSLLLADEPTGNLDTQSGLAIMHMLNELHKAGKTIVVATHDPRMLNFANKTIFLLDGKEVSESEYRTAIDQVG
ncbi:MAG: ABC transporter ATP-binding protein [Anaerolineaceae bacterium]|nr:ABC transporter ATP-binding protein [Anaerolineaceae bacterium]